MSASEIVLKAACLDLAFLVLPFCRLYRLDLWVETLDLVFCS